MVWLHAYGVADAQHRAGCRAPGRPVGVREKPDARLPPCGLDCLLFRPCPGRAQRVPEHPLYPFARKNRPYIQQTRPKVGWIDIERRVLYCFRGRASHAYGTAAMGGVGPRHGRVGPHESLSETRRPSAGAARAPAGHRHRRSRDELDLSRLVSPGPRFRPGCRPTSCVERIWAYPRLKSSRHRPLYRHGPVFGRFPPPISKKRSK